MNFKIYTILFFLNIHSGNIFLEKLTQSSNLEKTLLGIAATWPLAHGCFIQYHLNTKHEKNTECDSYSSHYLSNIPYFNILFYINTAITNTMMKILKKDHTDYFCLLKKKNFNRSNNDYAEKCRQKTNLFGFFGILDFICYCFLIFKLIRITQQR